MQTTTSRLTSGTEQLPAWPDAAEAYRDQSTSTCDHGQLLWQSCSECGVGRLSDEIVANLKADESPYEEIPAGQLRTGDVLASGSTVDTIGTNAARYVIATFSDGFGSAWQWPATGRVLIGRRAERVEARNLRDTDVLVNPENGETIPVRLVAPHNGLIMIWTDAVNAFAISPTATVDIKRRNGGA